VIWITASVTQVTLPKCVIFQSRCVQSQLGTFLENPRGTETDSMSLVYRYLFAAMWIGYLAYWRVKATNSKAAARTEPAESRLTRLVLILCSIGLLVLPPVPFAFLNARFLPRSEWCFWAGAVLTAVGLLFAAIPHVLL